MVFIRNEAVIICGYITAASLGAGGICWMIATLFSVLFLSLYIDQNSRIGVKLRAHYSIAARLGYCIYVAGISANSGMIL